jgi:thiamine biosynthesis lipoprotein
MRGAALSPHRRSDMLMGTPVIQNVHGINAAHVAEQVTAEIRWLEGLWSRFLDGSEVGLLHRFAGVRPVPVSPETIRLLLDAKEMHALSAGAFDVTVGPLTRLWGDALKKGALPEDHAIAAALTLKGSDEILAGNGEAHLPRVGQCLDLGAIGKGCAADRACDLYRDSGVRSAFISLGGNVAVVGRRPDGERWKVGIRNPAGGREDVIGFIEAEDCSVVTSGAYERFFECNGVRYHHILDPATGRPVETDLASVTVISRSSTQADALSTAVFVLGLRKGLEMIGSIEGIGAVLIDASGNVHDITSGSFSP